MVLSNKRKVSIREVLRGMEVGRMQSVGLMSVIPLTMNEDLHDERFASPMDGDRAKAEVSTVSYGSMVFDNSTDQTLLIPLNAGIVDKRQGQDHAISCIGLVKKRGRRQWDTAMCIQASQGGMIGKTGYRMLIIPNALREAALEKRDIQEYGKLWNDISEFNKSAGAHADGHLEFFLDKYKNELDQFVAEFECVPGQCGAIILIDGAVVGIERAPSPRYWRSIWDALIRECYGSVAIQRKIQLGEKAKRPQTRIPMRKVSTLEHLMEALDEVRQKEEEKAKQIIRDFIDDKFTIKSEDSVEGLEISTLNNRQFAGQVIFDSEKIIYGSLFTKKSWAKNAKWHAAEEFSI